MVVVVEGIWLTSFYPLRLNICKFCDFAELLASLSEDVFERLTSTGGGLFFHFWTVILPKVLDKSSLQ